jgi:SAM-dependent methyltransferase
VAKTAGNARFINKAVYRKGIPLSPTTPPSRKTAHGQQKHHNWLVHQITSECLDSELRKYAKGTLVDIGCGIKPYASLTKGLVEKHIGVDHAGTQHAVSNVDVFGTAYDTTLPDASADTVLSTAVLEHLERPQEALAEIFRILKPGGYLILAAPLFWHLHEEPRDFFRYTKYGLSYLIDAAGLEVVEITPMGGFIVTAVQEFCYYIDGFRNKFLRGPIRLVQTLLQHGAYRLRQFGRDRGYEYTWAYIAIAKKRPGMLAQ